MQHDPFGREPGRDGELQLPGGADVQTQSFLLHPAHHRAGEEGLGGVQDVGLGEGRAVGAAPLADLALVQNVGRGVEPVGDLRQGHPADGHVTVRKQGGGGGPHGQFTGTGRNLGEGGDGHGAVPFRRSGRRSRDPAGPEW